MKRLLLLVPLLLTACGNGADITTNEPFRIACVDKWKDSSLIENWFIDLSLNKANSEWSHEGKTGQQEADLISVSPEKIVIGEGWGYAAEDNIAGGEFTVFNRYLYTIDRLTGKMTREYFEATASEFPSRSYNGTKLPPAEGESYECEKPTKERALSILSSGSAPIAVL